MAVDLDKISDLLWCAWQLGQTIAELPRDLRLETREEGYSAQALLEQRSPGHVVGWKIAATSKEGQKHINVTGPLAGRIFSERLHGDGAVLSMHGNHMAVAEAEFVFGMASPLVPRCNPYSVDECLANVGGLYLGIEVPNSRYADYCSVGEANLIADDACAHEFVLGPRVSTEWREADLSAHRVHARVVGYARRYERDGVGANVLGDPRIALTWLVNELSKQSIVLAPGQFVSTGTCLVPLEIEAGDSVSVDFGELGRMSCRFSA
jgi:2-keto-4-pentenoate hydratase